MLVGEMSHRAGGKNWPASHTLMPESVGRMWAMRNYAEECMCTDKWWTSILFYSRESIVEGGRALSFSTGGEHTRSWSIQFERSEPEALGIDRSYDNSYHEFGTAFPESPSHKSFRIEIPCEQQSRDGGHLEAAPFPPGSVQRQNWINQHWSITKV